MRKLIMEIMRYFIIKHREKCLIFIDKKQCKKHANWEELAKEEKKLINKRDFYALKIFKNMWGYSEYFVSDAFYQCMLLPKLNKPNYHSCGLYHQGGYYSDKNYQDFFLGKSVKTPQVVIRNINGNFYNQDFQLIDKEEAIQIMNNYSELIFKVSYGGGHGRGVEKISQEYYQAEMEKRKADYVVQELIKQHDFLGFYNSSSVNIVRITSINYKGNTQILSGILRIGVPGALCDAVTYNGKHPLVIGLDENGKLNDWAVEPENCIIHNTVYGKAIRGQVPYYDEMKRIVIGIHNKFPKYGIIGWDMTINEKGEIICIEYNTGCPGIVQSQLVNGPIFGKEMDDGKILLEGLLENL